MSHQNNVRIDGRRRDRGVLNTNRPQTIVVLRTKQIYSKMTTNSRHKIYLQTVISVRQNVEANYFLMTEFKRSLIQMLSQCFI